MGDQYLTAHPNSRVQKETSVPFNAFACEGRSEASDEEVDAWLQRDSLGRHHHIKVGHGIRDLTHNLEQPVSTDWLEWIILFPLTNVSGMLVPTEGAGCLGVGAMRTCFVHTKTMTRAAEVVILRETKDSKGVFFCGRPHIC